MTSEQAQMLLDSNKAMMDGGGFTASDISFRLACMRVLGSLPEYFGVKTWRVVDESDLAGSRFVQAVMSFSFPESKLATSRAEGEGPVDALTRAMRQELEKWYPSLALMRLDTFSVTALDVSADDTAAYVRVAVSFHADGHEPWTTAGVSSDLNQAALMAIIDGFHYWLLQSEALSE